MLWNLLNGVCMLGRIVWCVGISASASAQGKRRQTPKGRKRRGRSSSDGTHTLLTEAQKLAPPGFFPREA